ncbi:SymE family type I addiction module toxin [Phaeocystidibacter marisrubri]|uniref:Type I toxin-antitoxin system SymE family toxin n=1 Tax=Phaeocystidibacter marisrubri TaxID=1577780 RepID=A0A6L3ZKK4_9FLAO|nr:SymE family type I addiction module toxin [Phaeocystidibacter marisrubri]KAB2818078.1 type I toxin-antitoxin system SymE family toxin [Phaeocystidibacter marisrubri]
MNRYRKLKIHSKYRPRRLHNSTVPQIRLEGRWLEELGFIEGQQVQIEQQYNKLTITLLKNK